MWTDNQYELIRPNIEQCGVVRKKIIHREVLIVRKPADAFPQLAKNNARSRENKWALTWLNDYLVKVDPRGEMDWLVGYAGGGNN